MRYTLLLLLPFLAACNHNTPKPCEERCVIKVPVYEKPVFDMPSRPVLIDTLYLKSDGEVVRAVQLNVSDLMTYSKSLETILLELKK